VNPVARNPVAKLVAFALLVAATFGAGAALGAVVGPIDTGDDHDTLTGDDHTERPTTTVTVDVHGPHGDH
jgi:hypothetical protein